MAVWTEEIKVDLVEELAIMRENKSLVGSASLQRVLVPSILSLFRDNVREIPSANSNYNLQVAN
jgi:hypothetical protein